MLRRCHRYRCCRRRRRRRRGVRGFPFRHGARREGGPPSLWLVNENLGNSGIESEASVDGACSLLLARWMMMDEERGIRVRFALGIWESHCVRGLGAVG
ncbi:hypothetical protein HKD37_14G041168 [Glycine soja]